MVVQISLNVTGVSVVSVVSVIAHIHIVLHDLLE